MTLSAKRAYSGLLNASAARSRRGDRAACFSLGDVVSGGAANDSRITARVREIAFASGRAGPVAAMTTGSTGRNFAVSQRAFRGAAEPHRRDQRIARIALDAEPGEQQEA